MQNWKANEPLSISDSNERDAGICVYGKKIVCVTLEVLG